MKWRDASESVPNVNIIVLLALKHGAISTGYIRKRRPEVKWYIDNDEEENDEVTHWMQLPKHPDDQ